MRRPTAAGRLIAAALAAICSVAAGCGSGDDAGVAPIACTGNAQSYLRALRSAPDAVLLGGETPISECLPSEQAAGDQAAVGTRMVAVATELNRRSRSDPGGAATVELGYLLGAVESGSSTTAGIHQDLVRRLQSAANFSPGSDGLGPRFQDAYDQGYAAGQDTG